MSFLLSVLQTAVVIWVCVDSQVPPEPETYIFNQRLDHFDPQNQRTFPQRYFVCDKYYNPSNKTLSTIFFYCGGEAALEEFWNNIGLPFDIAAEFNALIVFAEHRYYGASLPQQLMNASYFQYLSMEQAIADFAAILQHVQKTTSSTYNLDNAAVMAFGGSYGGILAALLRLHYGALFHIAVASSAPWLQLMNRASPTIYFEIVTNDYNSVDSRCPQIVRNGFRTMLSEYVNNSNYAPLQTMFNTCEAVTADNSDNFMNWIRNAFSVFAQSDYPYPTASFGPGMPAWPVRFVCEQLLIPNEHDALSALAVTTMYYYNNVSNNNQLQCLNVSALFPYCTDHCWCGEGAAALAWNYQQCTQIVISTNTNNVTDMFPPSSWEVSNMTTLCQQRFNVTPNPEWDAIWQPLDVEDVGQYIIWSNGELDPWSGGGFNANFTDNSKMAVFVIPQAAHHYDLRFAHLNDTASVIETRKQEVNVLWKWLAELGYN